MSVGSLRPQDTAPVPSDNLRCSEKFFDCNVRPESFFSSLPQECLADFDRLKRSTMYPKRTLIVVEGQAPHCVYLLREGRVKLTTSGANGKTLIVRIAGSGEMLGLHSVITGEPHAVSVETMQPCKLDFVARHDFLGFLRRHGEACFRAVEHLSNDCQATYELIRGVGLSHSISARLANFFLGLTGDGLVEGEVRVKLALTHDQISQVVGASRESVSRTLSQFRRQRMAEKKGATLIVYDKNALEQLASF